MAPSKHPNKPGNSPNTEYTGLVADLQRMGMKDFGTLKTLFDSAKTGVHNDRILLLERSVQLLAKLPSRSKTAKKITDSLVNDLWSSLIHPPYSSLGQEYKYREADGSNNNIYNPRLGAANTPYARSAKPMVFQHPNPPEASVIFDTLLVRDPAKFKPHPHGISSVLFYMASIITHDIFQTSHEDYNINLTSSYLDLSPLYGRNTEEQHAVRTMRDGLLKPDCFSSKRVLGFPPGVGVLLIMFNRFHNHVARRLAEINEGGRFTKPSSGTLDDSNPAWKKYDNDLFQTARLVTCGLYVNIIMGDYVRTILNLNRVETQWCIDPRAKHGKSLLATPTPEAVGNQVSVEFNMIYRWHCTLSQRDDQWTADELRGLLKGRDPATASLGEVLGAMKGFEATIPAEPDKRVLAGLERQADGSFDDGGLVDIMRTSIEDVAGAFAPNHIPSCMRAIEILGIKQARHWNVATLNEFRDFIGLARYETFEEINPDPEVVRKLSALYGSPDAVELSPGIAVEQTKPPHLPGSGLCPSFTAGRAILSDAVSLVRGDRFFTVDYTPKNLTNWGFNAASSDSKVNQGHIIYKLFNCAFPDHFAANSIHANFPFVVPSENKLILDKLGVSSRYSWDPPARRHRPHVVRSHAAAAAILGNKDTLLATWCKPLASFAPASLGGPTYNPFVGPSAKTKTATTEKQSSSFSSPSPAASKTPTREKEQQQLSALRAFYASTTRSLLASHATAVGIPGVHEIDVIREVIALAHARFTAAVFSIPLNSKASGGSYADYELSHDLTAAYAAAFWDVDRGAALRRCEAAREPARRLADTLSSRSGGGGGMLARLRDILGSSASGSSSSSSPELKACGEELVRHLVEGFEGSRMATSSSDRAWGFTLPAAAAWTASLTLLTAQSLEFYLGEGVGKTHLAEVQRLAGLDTPEAEEMFAKYVLEGARLNASAPAYRLLSSDQAFATFSLAAGRPVLVDLAAASLDASAVGPEPEAVRTDRPATAYAPLLGPWGDVGVEMAAAAAAAVVRAVLRLKGLRRADGARGLVKTAPAFAARRAGAGGKVEVDGDEKAAEATAVVNRLRDFMVEDQSEFSPVPVAMKIRWDDDA